MKTIFVVIISKTSHTHKVYSKFFGPHKDGPYIRRAIFCTNTICKKYKIKYQKKSYEIFS